MTDLKHISERGNEVGGWGGGGRLGEKGRLIGTDRKIIEEGGEHRRDLK